jgi:iron-sulfur cluster assembly protein
MAILLTESAVTQLKRTMTDHQAEGQVVRVGVTAGGCSGYSYVLEIVDEVFDTDRRFRHDGVQVVCDPRSYLYVNGLEIDFESSILGGGFKFNNPNVKRSCGCGTSFQA